MKNSLLLSFFLLVLSLPLLGQRVERDRGQQQQPMPQQSRVYFGGGLGLTFGNFTRIAVSPLVGYHFDPAISGGVRVNYEYVSDKRWPGFEQSYSSYGGGVFGRYRFSPRLYGHVEFDYFSYKFTDLSQNFELERYWVPFLYLGGGYVQPIGGSTSFIVEVLIDVIQDNRSPFRNWQPLITFGFGAGF